MGSTRRQFIKQCVLFYGSVLLLPACNLSGQRKKFYSFSVEDANVIEALCEQIVPADEFPGAKDAGVIHYIDKLLYQRFPSLKEKYEKGLAGLQRSVAGLYQKHFVSLEWEQQKSMLQQMERNELPEEYWSEISQREFFELILNHTMQGYYGSPRHGGNKDYVSYRMMKLDYPLLIGQNRYEK